MNKPWESYKAPEQLQGFADDIRGPIEEMDKVYAQHLAGGQPHEFASRLPHYPAYAEQIRLLVEVVSDHLRSHEYNADDISEVYLVLDRVFRDVAATRGSEVHGRFFYPMLAQTLSIQPENTAENPQVSANQYADRLKSLFLCWGADASRADNQS